MEKVKKYFEFSGTINGLNYFLRNLLTAVMAFFGGYMVGYGLGMQNMGLMTLGLVILAPTFWFNATTIWKRMNALYGENATLYTVGFFGLNIINQFISEEVSFKPIMTLLMFIIGLVLIFSNSKIENHEG
jgi:uncharacterized membrane protein YhaH (DUF805 family)